MTYKNIKFDESPVMRSLEKLAVKKGLVKPEILNKKASSKEFSLKPTTNLEENILKLCVGLRSSGFEKHAIEVEKQFFNLKRAQALYGTTGETGEDVINTAHPEGSHQMKDVEGDALVETEIDKQKAIQKMIAKAPTGKLGTRVLANFIKNAGKLEKNDAINAVKVILSQQTETEEQLTFKLNAYAKQFLSLLEKVNHIVDSEGNLNYIVGNGRQFNIGYNRAKSNLIKMPITLDAIKEIQSGINMMNASAEHRGWTGVPEDTWERIRGIFDVNGKFINLLNEMRRLRSDINKIEVDKLSESTQETNQPVNVIPTAIVGSPELGSLYNTIDENLRKLQVWQGFVSTYIDPDDVKEGTNYIASFKDQLNKISNALESVNSADAATIIPSYKASLKTLVSQMDEFYTKWIQAGE